MDKYQDSAFVPILAGWLKSLDRFSVYGLAWSKHGYTCFSPPDFEPTIDITIDMDVSINPGPWKNETLSTGKPPHELSATPPSCQITASRFDYSRNSLFRLSHYPKSVIETHIFEDLKRSGIFTYRGKPGGGRKTRRHAIPVLVTKSPVEKHPSICRGCNHNNLTRNNLSQIKNSSPNSTTEDKYAVPKCMFLNICSLTKTRNGIKANLALEADLFTNDIDICVVSETHLKRIVPDSVAAISIYTIHRRDRNWFDKDKDKDKDKREKGGVAIYVRKNVKVKSVSRSELFESISLEIELPSGHHMLMCGIC